MSRFYKVKTLFKTSGILLIRIKFFYKKGYFFHHLKSWLQIVWSMILTDILLSLIAPFLILKKTHTLHIVESQLTRNLITFSIIKKPIIPIWLKWHMICIQFQLCLPNANMCLVVLNCLLLIGEPEWKTISWRLVNI